MTTLIAFSFLTASACADGMMTLRTLGQSVSMVESPKQEALLVVDGRAGEISVSLRTHFLDGPTELAWVVPVPGVPEKIAKGDEEVFRMLEAETAPEFWILARRDSMFGCSGGGTSRVQQGVRVIQSGTAGIFDYVVLNASNSTELEDWLNSNGYRVPADSERVLQSYVDRGWHWLAIQIRAEERGQPRLAPHPITYRYRSSRLEYPLVISRLSATDEVEVVLYVLANCEYGAENWANVQLQGQKLVLDESSPSGTNYEALFRQFTTDHGGHLFVTEFASDLDTVGYRPFLADLLRLKSPAEILTSKQEGSPYYLTRLRAVVDKRALDRDVVLVPTRVSEYDFVLNSHDIRVSGEGEQGLIAWIEALGFAVVMGVIYVTLRTYRRRVY